MRKFWLSLFLFLFIEGISQPESKSSQEKTRHGLILNDSTLSRLKRLDDSLHEEAIRKEELKDIERMSQRSTNYFAQLQRERHAKEKRNAIMRISIGIIFLIILIVGLRRRKVKKQE